jgi:hypothetical protein
MLSAPLAQGQPVPPPEAPDVGPAPMLEAPPPETLNKIGLNYRMGLNITADFRKLGGLHLSDPGAKTGTAVNRTYDNGTNGVDIDNNVHGDFTGTWYWGWSSTRSHQGDYLVLQSDSTLPNASSNNHSDDPQHGVELTYSRELYRGKGWRTGVEAALGYTRIVIDDTQTLKNTVFRTNDAFALEGVVLTDPAQYTFAGPGRTISSQPSTRTLNVLPNAATITGTRELDANVFLLRLGPYLEVPLSEKFSVILDGGLTLAVGVTDFSFREDVNISDPGYGINIHSSHRAGSGSQTDFLVGGYAGASLAYALTKEISLVVGAQFQAAGQAVNNEKGKEAILDLGKSISVSIGATYSF